MSIYQRLKDDHRDVKHFLKELDEKSARASKSKSALFDELKQMVTAHARAEEKVFYDTLKSSKTAHNLALEGYEEHHVVDALLQEMSQLSSGDDQWQAKLSVVTENLEHHIKEEEEEIFPNARKILSDKQAEELGEAFTAEKSKYLSTAG